MRLGKITSITCASGSSFSLPRSAWTTRLTDWRFRSSREARRLGIVALLQRGQLGLESLDLRTAADAAQLEAPQGQPEPLLLPVDGADVPRLDPPDLAPRRLAAGKARPHHLPALLGPARDDPPAVAHLLERADQHAPLGPLDHGEVGGIRRSGDLALRHPLEVRAVQVPVGDLELDAVLPALVGNRLAIDDLTGQDGAVRQRHPRDVLRPEEAQAVHQDERDEPGHEDERQRERPARQPDERLTAAPEPLSRSAHR